MNGKDALLKRVGGPVTFRYIGTIERMALFEHQSVCDGME